jgi:hypothetical protein
MTLGRSLPLSVGSVMPRAAPDPQEAPPRPLSRVLSSRQFWDITRLEVGPLAPGSKSDAGPVRRHGPRSDRGRCSSRHHRPVSGSFAMNKAPPYSLTDIIDLDANRLPKQVWRTDSPKTLIGPAFKTETDAIASDPMRHTAQIFSHDVDGKVIFDWWEASQSGLPDRLGHTEQKALLRMHLRRGLYVLMQGTYPCCPYGSGCMNALVTWPSCTIACSTTGLRREGRYITSNASGGAAQCGNASCRQLSQTTPATSWMAAKKLRAVFS